MTPVCSISKNAILSVKNCGIADILEEAELAGVLGLSIALAYEISLGDRSPWAGYIASLPERENIPIFWTSEQLKELEGTDLGDDVEKDKELLIEDYETHVRPLTEEHPDVLPASKMTLDLFLRSTSLVASRAFQVDNYHGDSMVPLADIFNHKTGKENVHFETDVDCCPDCGSLGGCYCDEASDLDDASTTSSTPTLHDLEDELEPLYPDPDELCCTMSIVRPCLKGEEVFNTYGQHPNKVLLSRYGFCEMGNSGNVRVDLGTDNKWVDEIVEAVGDCGGWQVDEEDPEWEDESDGEGEEGWEEDGGLVDDYDDQMSDGSDDGGDESEEDDDEVPAPDLSINPSGSPSPDLLVLLHLLHMSRHVVKELMANPEELSTMCEQIRSGGWIVEGDEDTGEKVGNDGMEAFKAVPSPIARAVEFAIKDLIVRRLEKYPTSLEVDKKRLARDGEEEGPLRWALILRIGEKEALMKGLEKYDNHLDPI